MDDSPLNHLVLIGVGSSFASWLFYHLYQEKKIELQKLKEIPVFKPDQHLLKVVKASPHKRLQYVAVEGMVQPDGEPLASKFVPQRFGVIQKIVSEEHCEHWDSTSRSWNSKTIKRNETNDSVPFTLISPGAYIADASVKVHEPQKASGSYLERVYFKVRHAEEGLVDIVVQELSGEKHVKMKETEELLHVGSTLTGFGEVVLEKEQVMRLQAPLDNRKYILMPTDYRSFINRHEASASMWKSLAAVTGITGASLLAGVFFGFFGKQNDKSK